MERSGDAIINSAGEQALYNVLPEVSVESALKTASVFIEIADRLVTKSQQTIDSSNSEVALVHDSPDRRYKDLRRASELRSYARGVMRLCTAEIIEKLTDSEFPPIE